jgi:hypothetical protein
MKNEHNDKTDSYAAMELMRECSWINARIRRDTERRERVIELLREIDARTVVRSAYGGSVS